MDARVIWNLQNDESGITVPCWRTFHIILDFFEGKNRSSSCSEVVTIFELRLKFYFKYDQNLRS
jgi:hypothetical protein